MPFGDSASWHRACNPFSDQEGEPFAVSLVTPFVPDVPLGLHESMPETKSISFADSRSEFLENLLDIINPLQHIPGVSTIYRAITGDEISAPARLIGGALFGGPIGVASATANMLLEEASGNDLAGHALAFIGGLGDTPEIAAAAFTPLAPQAAIDLVAADGRLKTVAALASAETPAAPAPAVIAAPSPVTPPAPQAAANLATAGGGVEIIWNGPRVLPSLARAPASQSNSASGSAAEVSAVEAPASDAAASNTGAIKPAPGTRPAWLGAAITDAQTVREAAQLGRAAQKVEGQPWVSNAMIDALDKYETLTRERNR